MEPFDFKQRIYAFLLALGAGFLLYRTITMVAHGALDFFVLWVAILLILEMSLDFACLVSACWWGFSNEPKNGRLTLRLAAAVAIFHALRVLVFVMGRLETWLNFDVRPEHRALHHTRWSWDQVYFAATMSILGIIGVLVIWRLLVRSRKSPVRQLKN